MRSECRAQAVHTRLDDGELRRRPSIPNVHRPYYCYSYLFKVFLPEERCWGESGHRHGEPAQLWVCHRCRL